MKILVPVDGSNPALDAVRHAITLRQAGLHASFVLINVQPPAYPIETILSPGSDAIERSSGIVGLRTVQSAEALFEAAAVPFTREIVFGEPVSELLECARRLGCEAIIMGARGMGALRAAVLGSTSQAVVHASAIPVTIVKHGGR